MSAPVNAPAWLVRARAVTPGGVHSPVRAFGAMGVEPVAVVEGRGATVRDTAGRSFVDYIGAWGPALLGHAHPDIEDAVVSAARRGPSSCTTSERLSTPCR